MERGKNCEFLRSPILKHEWCSLKAQINCSLYHITATFGNAIAGIIINHIIDKETKE